MTAAPLFNLISSVLVFELFETLSVFIQHLTLLYDLKKNIWDL